MSGLTVRCGAGRVYRITRAPGGYAVRPRAGGPRHVARTVAAVLRWALRHAWRRAAAERDWRAAERRAVASGRFPPAGAGR